MVSAPLDTLARTFGAPTSRRAALGAAVAGGLLSALGTRAAQAATCRLDIVATIRLGPSAGVRIGLRRLGEPGDHLYRSHGLVRAPISHRYVHRFRDHAEAEAELADAGLVVSDRIEDSCWVVRPRP